MKKRPTSSSSLLSGITDKNYTPPKPWWEDGKQVIDLAIDQISGSDELQKYLLDKLFAIAKRDLRLRKSIILEAKNINDKKKGRIKRGNDGRDLSFTYFIKWRMSQGYRLEDAAEECADIHTEYNLTAKTMMNIYQKNKDIINSLPKK